MRVVGLTGGIGSGKTTVVSMVPRDVPIIDCDCIARQVVAPGTRAYSLIVRRFASSSTAVCERPGGPLDRAALARLVFTDRNQRMWLNGVMQWRIGVELTKQLLWHWLRGESLVIVDAPLLFESRLHRFMSCIICISVSLQTQLERVMMRDQIDGALARSKIDAQLPTAEKCKRSDFVIDNEGSMEETRVRVAAVLAQVRARRAPLYSRLFVFLLLLLCAGNIGWLISKLL